MRQILRYFFHNPRRLPRVPRQYIGNYNYFNITEEQKKMMLLGYARSPQEAQRLLDNAKLENARDYLAAFPRKKPSLIERLKRRFISLWNRIEGSSTRSPFSGQIDDKIPYQVEFWEDD